MKQITIIVTIYYELHAEGEIVFNLMNLTEISICNQYAHHRFSFSFESCLFFQLNLILIK